MNKRTVSYSLLSCFKNCPHAYRLKYLEKLEPIRVVKPLYKGSAIHSLLEYRIKHLMFPLVEPTWEDCLHQTIEPEFMKLTDTDKESLGLNFIEDLERIMKQYDWCYQDENIEYKEVEKWIEYKLFSFKKEPVLLVGKVDAIVKINGVDYIVEHKTFSSNPMSLNDTWINMQTCLYAYILNKKYGYNIKGVLWDMIKTEPYADPNILKSGQYGKQSSKVTLLSFKENPGTDIINQVKDNHLNFLQRFITPIVPTAVDSFFNETKNLAKELIKRGTSIIDIKRLTRDCSWCAYHDICQSELTGGDTDYIKQLLFKHKEDN